MRILLVYDGLFPFTLGGADRWYRNLAEELARRGHDVTLATSRQWRAGRAPVLQGVRVIAVAPNLRRRNHFGRRHPLFPVLFGLGLLRYLLRHGRAYDVVHMAAFPYTTLLAAALARSLGGYRLVADWHELFTRAYWRELLGSAGGTAGWLLQRAAARTPHVAVAFSELQVNRLRQAGRRGDVMLLRGQLRDLPPCAAGGREPLVVFAGRHTPEKRPLAVVESIARARAWLPELRAVLFGDGPERAATLRAVQRLGLTGAVEVEGMAPDQAVEQAVARALCVVHPSRREGFGLVVAEALAWGTPVIVVRGPDNAATELIEDGVNGIVVPSADPEALAEAIRRVYEAGDGLRSSTRAWFAAHAAELSLATSIDRLLLAY